MASVPIAARAVGNRKSRTSRSVILKTHPPTARYSNRDGRSHGGAETRRNLSTRFPRHSHSWHPTGTSGTFGTLGTLFPLSPPIERDGEHDDGSGHDLLHPVRIAFLRAPDLNHGHRRRAQQCPDDRAASTGEAAAADDHRGDDVELETVGDRRDRRRRVVRTAGRRRLRPARRRACRRRSWCALRPRHRAWQSARSSRSQTRGDRSACIEEGRRRSARAAARAIRQREAATDRQGPSSAAESLSHVCGASIRRSSATPLAAPRTRIIVPRVTIKGTTRSPVTRHRSPLRRRHRQHTRLTRRHSGDHPSPSARAMTTVVSATTEPTERSMPPDTITTSCQAPRPTRWRSDARSTRDFPAERNARR